MAQAWCIQGTSRAQEKQAGKKPRPPGLGHRGPGDEALAGSLVPVPAAGWEGLAPGKLGLLWAPLWGTEMNCITDACPAEARVWRGQVLWEPPALTWLSQQVGKMTSSDPERPQFLFVKALASRGRAEAVTQQMGYHPQYLDSFLKTQHYLLHMDGPLPFACRHYIAIMVRPRAVLCHLPGHDQLGAWAAPGACTQFRLGWNLVLLLLAAWQAQGSAWPSSAGGAEAQTGSCRQLPGTSAATW